MRFFEVIFMNNINMNMLFNMLSKMDKKDLEKGIEQANKILKSKNKEDILKQIQDHDGSNKMQ